MNTESPDSGVPDGTPAHRRPLGFWLRVVDAELTEAFASAFAEEGISRRDWMLLNVVSGDVDAPTPRWRRDASADATVDESEPAGERPRGRGRRGRHDSPRRLKRLARLAALAERGWITAVDGKWQLTDLGRAEKERIGLAVATIRECVAGAVSPEDYATTMASLEAIARELGWEPGSRPHRGAGHKRRHGHGRGRRFGRGFSHGVDLGCRGEHGREHGRHEHGHHKHGHHKHGRHHHGRHEHGHRGHGRPRGGHLPDAAA